MSTTTRAVITSVTIVSQTNAIRLSESCKRSAEKQRLAGASLEEGKWKKEWGKKRNKYSIKMAISLPRRIWKARTECRRLYRLLNSTLNFEARLLTTISARFSLSFTFAVFNSSFPPGLFMPCARPVLKMSKPITQLNTSSVESWLYGAIAVTRLTIKRSGQN